MYQNYFFDFDGTLYDTYPGMVKAFVEAFALQGVELSPNEVYQVMREASVREAYRRYTTSQLDATKLHADYRNLEEKYQVTFLPSDFKKKNGYKESIELSKKYHLYRQDYCGCIFSKEEREQQKKGQPQ